jgi:hypothetical protein
MIVFDLSCGNDHVFEAWFRDSAAFEGQAERAEIACPVCGDRRVRKAPMAPRISTGKGRRREPEPQAAEPQAAEPQAAPPPAPDAPAEALRALRRLQTFIEKNFTNVGARFPEEARKIHYGEAEKRAIYGDATEAETDALREEGIEVERIPWLPPHDA